MLRHDEGEGEGEVVGSRGGRSSAREVAGSRGGRSSWRASRWRACSRRQTVPSGGGTTQAKSTSNFFITTQAREYVLASKKGRKYALARDARMLPRSPARGARRAVKHRGNRARPNSKANSNIQHNTLKQHIFTCNMVARGFGVELVAV